MVECCEGKYFPVVKIFVMFLFRCYQEMKICWISVLGDCHISLPIASEFCMANDVWKSANLLFTPFVCWRKFARRQVERNKSFVRPSVIKVRSSQQGNANWAFAVSKSWGIGPTC